MSRFVLLLLAGLSLAFAPAPFRAKKQDAVAVELKALQGEWVIQKYVYCGRPITLPEGSSEAFAGGRCVVRYAGEVVSRWKITLDHSRSPRVMTMVGEGPAGYVGKIILCRYRLDGDTLTLCWNEKGDTIPDNLEPNKSVAVQVYKRKKL
jgi:uncharacterized protein (TIGR03067 family)